MRAFFWKAHRWLGIVTCIAILLWATSGISHPIMSRLQPAPKSFMPPKMAFDVAAAPSPVAMLKAAGLQQVVSLDTVSYQGQAHWLAHAKVQTPGVLLHAQTGAVVADGERKLAQALASHYTGRNTDQIISTDLVTRFDDEYLPVNRLLPVWRVSFRGSDQLTAYIDTRQMRLTTLIDRTRSVLSHWFRFAHNWSFLSATPRLQLIMMSTALAAILTSALTGLYFWWSMRASAAQRLAQKPLKRWHRRLGLIVALTSLTFGSSGLFHLWVTGLAQQDAVTCLPNSIGVDELGSSWVHMQHQPSPSGRVTLVSTPGLAGWLIEPARQAAAPAQVAAMSHAEHHHGTGKPSASNTQAVFMSLDGATRSRGSQMVAAHVARQFSLMPDQQMGTPTLVTQFGGEYGFVNKRLPVWRIPYQGPDNPRFYVEPQTATLAAKVTDLEATEGWSFATLHKWNIGPINKDVRDVLSVLFAFGNAAVAVMGLILFVCKTR